MSDGVSSTTAATAPEPAGWQPAPPLALAAASLLVAIAGTGGSLYLSLGMDLRACPLCFYQRTFAMAAMSVLAACLWLEKRRPGLACLLVVPLAWGGWGVAGFHQYLVLSGVLECPRGVLAWGTAPAQSLAMFSLLAICCTCGAWMGRDEAASQRPRAILMLMVWGALLAWSCIASSPPLPPAPSQPYPPEQPLEICRPPFPGG